MGTPMALRLLAAGHELSVWNRSEERTKPLIHEGAIAAATPAEAELGSDAVITMLLDDAAYEEVLFGVHRLIDVLSLVCFTSRAAPSAWPSASGLPWNTRIEASILWQRRCLAVQAMPRTVG